MVFSSLSLFSFLFCVPYSCLPTVSLEVDVQTLKPPGAKPRTGKYVRVGKKKIIAFTVRSLQGSQFLLYIQHSEMKVATASDYHLGADK